MRFLEGVPSETISLLRRGYRESKQHRGRARAHGSLLSAQGYTTPQVMEIFDVDPRHPLHLVQGVGIQRGSRGGMIAKARDESQR